MFINNRQKETIETPDLGLKNPHGFQYMQLIYMHFFNCRDQKLRNRPEDSPPLSVVET